MFARLFLTASLLVATQLALQHPLDHLWKSSAPAQEQHCDACVAFAPIGSAAVSHVTLHIEVPPAGFASVVDSPVFTAAFTPHFRSQAPPAVL